MTAKIQKQSQSVLDYHLNSKEKYAAHRAEILKERKLQQRARWTTKTYKFRETFCPNSMIDSSDDADDNRVVGVVNGVSIHNMMIMMMRL